MTTSDVQQPRHPDLLAHHRSGRGRAIYYRGHGGVEAVVARGTILAVRGKGAPRKAPAKLLGDHHGDFQKVTDEMLRASDLLPDKRPSRSRAEARPEHPRGGSTTVVDVLLPKDRFPTPADAARWLLKQKHPYRVDQIEDSGTNYAGNFWQAHQFDPPEGKPLRFITFTPKKDERKLSRIKARIVVDGPVTRGPKRGAKALPSPKPATKRSTTRRTGAAPRTLGAPIVMLSCSKTKLGGDMPVRAKDLYTSGLFKDTYAYAEQLTKRGGAIRILSAQHGLLKPNTRIPPEDTTLEDMRAPERRAWGQRVLAQMVKEFGKGKRRFICLAGEKYTEAIHAAGPPPTWTCDEPLKGESIGVRWKHVRSLLAKAR